jgi:cupin 2 domain-containing protein
MNLFDIHELGGLFDEVAEEVAEIAGVRIERIVSSGQRSPEGFWYDQDHDEWVTVLQGEGVVGFEDGRDRRLGPGDTLMLPAHVRHRVVSTSADPPCIWLAVHGPERHGLSL